MTPEERRIIVAIVGSFIIGFIIAGSTLWMVMQ